MSDFQPSALGTQIYWDNYYIQELKNFDEIGDVGEIWFGKSSEKRILNYFKKVSVPLSSRILDAGCGNGHFCIELARVGFSDITGVDYAPQAVLLSTTLLRATHLSVPVSFKCVDLLSSESIRGNFQPNCLFDVVVDKGTFDAISLSGGTEAGQHGNSSSPSRQNRRLYLEHIFDLLNPGGFFILTSCNWTGTELIAELEGAFSRESDSASRTTERRCFKFLHEVPSLRTFTFAGVTGSDTVCLVFAPVWLEA